VAGCAWCPEDGKAHCNLLSYFSGEDRNTCSVELYSNQTSCDCEDLCHSSYEKYSPSCNGGVKACGSCQDCPDGAKGKFCQCSATDIAIECKLKELPHVTIGRKDDLLSNSGKADKDKVGFHHIIPPRDTNPGLLRCNSTYCMNSNSKQCFDDNYFDNNFDFGRFANIFAIYGDQRLLPGSELVFKIAHCPLKKGVWDEYETWFGFGTPVSKEQEYTLPRKNMLNDLMQFYTDEAYMWQDEAPEFRDHRIRWSMHHFSTRVYEYDDRKVYDWGSFVDSYNITGVDDSLGYVTMNIGTEIKLVVSDTEAVWSWEGFHSEENPNLEDVRIPINMLEKQYYPFFILPGCEEEGQFSAIEIVRSKIQT